MIKVLLIVRTDRGFVLGTSNDDHAEPLQFDYNALSGVAVVIETKHKMREMTGIKAEHFDFLEVSSEWSDFYGCHTVVYAYKHTVECPPYGQPYNCCELHGDQTLIRRAFFALSPNADEDSV